MFGFINFLRTTKLRGWRAESAWQMAIAFNCIRCVHGDGRTQEWFRYPLNPYMYVCPPFSVAIALPFALDAVVDYKKKHYPNVIRSELSQAHFLELVSAKRALIRSV